MRKLIILLCFTVMVARGQDRSQFTMEPVRPMNQPTAGGHTSHHHTDNKPKKADCGEPPADAEVIARRYLLETALKDPDSAKIEFVRIEPATLYPSLNAVHACWEVRLNVNARNSFGGYAGWGGVSVYLNANGKVVNIYESPFGKY